MSVQPRRTWITMMGLLFIISISSSIAQARLACGTLPLIVTTESDLNDAIACYNVQTTVGIYDIDITADITLTASTTTIDNATSGVELVINGGGNTVDGNYNFPPFMIEADTDVTINNLTIENGFAYEGGGIYNHRGSLTLTYSIIRNNAASRGGGIYNAGGTLMLTHTILVGNHVTDVSASSASWGGGIYTTGILTIHDSIISYNTANNYNLVTGNSARGGGIFNHGGILTVSDTTIADNLVTDEAGEGSGGGIYNVDGTMTIISSAVDGNSADGETDAKGGGVYNYNGILMITASTFSDNTTNGTDAVGGGIFNADSSTLTITGSLLSGNTTRGINAAGGGGIFNSNASTMTVINSTLSGNAATSYNDQALGGGIYNSYATATVLNSTLNSNSATGATFNIGGGLLNIGSTVTMTNTIIANSLSGGDCFGTVIFTGLNLIEDGSCLAAANGQLTGDPMLGPLADNGGATQTHALLPGSPAIDVGVNALAVDADGNPLLFDQRGTGFPRINNGTVDLGAFEAPAPDPCTGLSPNVDNDVRNGDTHLNSPYNNGAVHNTSGCFSYEVSIAVYKILDTPGSPHLLHDAETVTVGPNETVNFGINLPDCMVEVYLFYGPVIDNLDNETYAAQGRELDSMWLNGTGPCPDPFGGDPDPDPDPPVCTPNPDGDLKHSGSHLNPPFDNGTVTNLSDACTYEIGIASYMVMDGSVATQQLLGSQTMSIGPGQTVNLGPVPLAEGCSTQVDLFYGGVINDFSGGARYDNRLIDVRWVGSGDCGGG